jgi:hypothetical protein
MRGAALIWFPGRGLRFGAYQILIVAMAQAVARANTSVACRAVSRAGDRLYSVAQIDDEREAAPDTFARDAKAMQLIDLAGSAAEGQCRCHVSLHEDVARQYE